MRKWNRHLSFGAQTPAVFTSCNYSAKKFFQSTIIFTPFAINHPLYGCTTHTHRSPAGPLPVPRVQAPAGRPAGPALGGHD